MVSKVVALRTPARETVSPFSQFVCDADLAKPWIGQPHVTVLTINRLTRPEVDAMIDRVIGNKQLPANVSRRDHAPQSRNRKMFLIACYNSIKIA